MRKHRRKRVAVQSHRLDRQSQRLHQRRASYVVAVTEVLRAQHTCSRRFEVFSFNSSDPFCSHLLIPRKLMKSDLCCGSRMPRSNSASRIRFNPAQTQLVNAGTRKSPIERTERCNGKKSLRTGTTDASLGSRKPEQTGATALVVPVDDVTSPRFSLCRPPPLRSARAGGRSLG